MAVKDTVLFPLEQHGTYVSFLPELPCYDW